MQVKIEIDPAATDPVVTIRTATLKPALNQLVTQLQSQTPTLTFFQGDTEYYLDLNEILFFEVSDRRTWAHTATGLYQVKWRLKDLEARLPHHFLRCAKSVILNLHQIYSLTRNLTGCEIHFAHTDKRVFVSRHYYQALRDALAERMN